MGAPESNAELKKTFMLMGVFVVMILIMFYSTYGEHYSTPVATNTPMMSGYTQTYDYIIQHPKMLCPRKPRTCGCETLERNYPVWKRDEKGNQVMYAKDGRLNIQTADEHLANPNFKPYGWRHHQYTGDPYKAHRWYNNPDTMDGIWPANSIFKFNEECVFGDESLPTAVARSTGYDDLVDNDGVDGNFQYPDSVGSHMSN